MLVSLQVRDFAIVDRIEVEFEPGMTVLTGETGAGKSILVDALGLVLGERGSAQLLRSGAKRAEFSAEFDIAGLPGVRDWLVAQSLDDGNECLLRRVINADGRSRAFINGNAVPVQQLKTIGEHLVDIHGQHIHQSLGRAAVQRDLLDYFGGLQDERRKTGEAFKKWQVAAEQLRQLTDAEVDRASKIDLLTFQLQELRSLDLQPGEPEQLLGERQRLQNSGRLGEGVAHALSTLFDNDSANANTLLADASRALDTLLRYDESLAPVREQLDSASIQISEAVDELRRYIDSIDIDPRRRDEVEERLDAIQAISRKHRVEANELPALETRISDEYERLVNADELGRELEQEVLRARDRYLKFARVLSGKRHKAGKKLSAAVTEAMQGLGMPGGVFDISLEKIEEHAGREHGVDNIDFLITANPGQPLMPLKKIASGGELSRMSLAIQVIVSDGSAIPTMVFDEVDAGVGGGVAEMLGRRLAELGRSRQVFCVTHLAQVASLATHHFRIAKVTDGKATRTTVQSLSQTARIEELARMLGGVEITRKTLDHAAEMLERDPKKRA